MEAYDASVQIQDDEHIIQREMERLSMNADLEHRRELWAVPFLYDEVHHVHVWKVISLLIVDSKANF